MRLRNILIVVNDIEKSKAFYKELFGLDVITDFGGNVILTEGLVLQERKSWEELVGRQTIYGGHDAELFFVENDRENFLNKLRNTSFEIVYVDEKSRESERVDSPEVVRIMTRINTS